jgi:MFS family permease
MDTADTRNTSLYSPEFIILSVIVFLAFCNISLFYGFNAYLEAIDIPPMWRGFLLGLEAGTALLVRPVISPLLTVNNGVRTLAMGLLVVMMALLGYSHAQGLWALSLVRITHGLGFVLLISAGITLLVEYIPAHRSGEGFGVFAVASLLPYAVIPPMVEYMLPSTGNESVIYGRFTLLFLPALLLLIPLRRSVNRLQASLPTRHGQRPTLAEIRTDLRSPGVARLLVVNLALFAATTVVFFYMKDRLLALGAGNPGLFFTIATVMTILVRLACGKLLDKVNRAKMLTLFLGVLALTLCLFGLVDWSAAILALAAVYGVCLGFIVPQVNASMFVISPPHLRGLNTNLLLSAMDGGYCLGPLLAGLLQAQGMGLSAMITLCAAGPVLAGALTWSLITRMSDPDTRS